MPFTFRPAVRESVSLLIGLAGASGAGKSYTAMRLAAGLAGDRPFCVIDTEAGRAKHYADLFKFDHGDLAPPFSPGRYAEAIEAADAAGYPVIVVDSCSHSHAGVGGILDMQEAEFTRMGGKDSAKMASWVKPKGENRKMVQRLLQVRAHLILTFRAEEKIEMVRGANGIEVRKKVTPTGLDGWQPICEKNLPYELTASFLLMASRPGVPLPIKLQEQHKGLFPLDAPITEDSGRRLAEWARGGDTRPDASVSGRASVASAQTPSVAGADGLGVRDDRHAAPPTDRERTVAEIKRLSLKHKLSAEARFKLREQFLGGAALEEASNDPAALDDVLRAIKAMHA